MTALANMAGLVPDVRGMHERFPNAKHYGTARHLARYPKLRWQALRTEDAELHQMFSEDFDFSIPRGVDFISSNENIHFSSVLVYHRASKTIHVDDTLNYTKLPKAARLVGQTDSTTFQPTLPFALEKRAGAAQEFRRWAEEGALPAALAISSANAPASAALPVSFSAATAFSIGVGPQVNISVAASVESSSVSSQRSARSVT